MNKEIKEFMSSLALHLEETKEIEVWEEGDKTIPFFTQKDMRETIQ